MKLSRLLPVPVLTGLLYGYHIGIIAPALPLLKIQYHFSAWQAAHSVSLFIIGLILGALVTPPLLKRLSRKQLLQLAAVLMIAQAIYGFIVADFVELLAYRLFSGLASGIMATCGPMIAVENSSIEQRGKLASLFQAFIVIGIMLSFAVGLICLAPGRVDVMFLAGAIPALLALYFFCQLDRLQEAISASSYEFKKYKSSYIVALGLNFFQQASGINAITFFSQTLFAESLSAMALSAYYLPVFFNIGSLISTLFVMQKIDRWGRKPFLLIGALGMCLAMGMQGITTFSYLMQFYILLFFSISFAISLGPITYLVTNEVFPDNLRAKGASLAFFFNCMINYLLSLAFLPLKAHFGVSVVWSGFSLLCLCAFVFIWRRVPETVNQKTETIVKNLNHLR